MRCNCGAADCRGVVRNIAKLPLATIRKYRRLGIVPEFIVESMRGAEQRTRHHQRSHRISGNRSAKKFAAAAGPSKRLGSEG